MPRCLLKTITCTSPPPVLLAQPDRTLIPRITEKTPRRGIITSVPDLTDSIKDHMQVTNADPKPYVWTATAQSILSRVARARTSLHTQANQN